MEPCLQKLELKRFRCFDQATFSFDGPLILLEGINGSGKTSLFEALYYICYLRSFRTSSPKDLVQFGQTGFFIKALFNNQEIKIGYSNNKRHIKVDQQVISSYEQLREHYRIVSVTEDDLCIVKNSPDKRRDFLDHALLLFNPKLLSIFKSFKIILDNRNALLHQLYPNQDELEIWTKKLWEQTIIVQEHRKNFIEQLQTICDTFLHEQWNGAYQLQLTYQPKKIDNDQWQDFYKNWQTHLFQEERRFKRSLFGAHLDDFSIIFQNKPARLFSSRGQQKLIVLLIKIAQVKLLLEKQGSTCFLIDDFMTDFDEMSLKKIISVCVTLKTQLIFTTPIIDGVDSLLLKSYGAVKIAVSSNKSSL